MPIFIKWDAPTKNRKQAVRAHQKLFGGKPKINGRSYGPYGGILSESDHVGRALVKVESEKTAKQVEDILRYLGLKFRRL